MSEFDIVSEFEHVVLSIKECYVFKIPPLLTAAGHRAEAWGIDKPLFTGLLKIFQKDSSLRIVIYRYKDEKSTVATDDNLVEFGECPITIAPKENITPFVDSVADSSRYFVVRLKDRNSSRSVSIGIGFRERDTALDFKNALNDYVRYIDRMAAAAEMRKQAEDTNSNDSSAVSDDSSTTHSKFHKDLSIKSGEKNHVTTKIGLLSSRRNNNTSSPGSLKLAPPPPPGSVVQPGTALLQSHSNHTKTEGLQSKEEDEDFGDFSGFTSAAESSSVSYTSQDAHGIVDEFAEFQISQPPATIQNNDEWGDFKTS